MARRSLPGVAVGAVLRIGSDDWCSGRALAPGTEVVVVLTDLTGSDTNGWVWVRDHRPQCAYPRAESQPPWLELLSRVAALRPDAR